MVLSGRVEIVDAAGSEHERVLVEYGPRQFVGEMNLITAEPTLMTARVARPARVCSSTSQDLRGVVAGDSRLGDMLINAMVTPAVDHHRVRRAAPG